MLLATGLKRKVGYEGEYEPGKKIKRMVSAHSDIVKQITNVVWEIEWENTEGWHSKCWEMPFRFYFRYVVEHLIARSPLKLKRIFDDFKRKELDSSSREMIIVCSRN